MCCGIKDYKKLLYYIKHTFPKSRKNSTCINKNSYVNEIGSQR